MHKLDIFNHFLPPPYFEKMQEVAPGFKDMGKRVRRIKALVDLDSRFRIMDAFGADYRQVVSTSVPSPDELAAPNLASELARVANDSLAELALRHPDRFAGFVGTVAMSDPSQALQEAERAVKELGACGVQIYTNVAGRPLDEPEFEPFFACLAELDRPVWLHPTRGASMTDYASEDRSKFEIWWTFGWPYETSVAMARMVFSGLLDRYPTLKVITHHLGGMVPYFEGRVGPGWDQLGKRTSEEDYTKLLSQLQKPHLDYFKGFYADTATFGSRAATRCGLDFFGVDNVLFASDSPFDPEGGSQFIRETLRVLDELDLSEEEREKIYWKNANRLLKLELKG